MADNQAAPGPPEPATRLRRTVLRKLARWRRITFGDLLSMLAPEERLQFRRQMIDELQTERLIQVSHVGDDEVLAMTEDGARWLAEHGGP